MGRMPFKNKLFKDLQAEWYKVLKDSGFKDIEQDEDNLKRWDSHHFKAQTTPTAFQTKQDYYRLAGQFLHDYTFEEEWHTKAWEYHVEGLSTRDIVRTMKSQGYALSRDKIFRLIKELSTIMVNGCLPKK